MVGTYPIEGNKIGKGFIFYLSKIENKAKCKQKCITQAQFDTGVNKSSLLEVHLSTKKTLPSFLKAQFDTEATHFSLLKRGRGHDCEQKSLLNN
jgi:hypothetical protein